MNLITLWLFTSCPFNLFIACSLCRSSPHHIGPQHHQISSPWHLWNRHWCKQAPCAVHLPDAGLPVWQQPGYYYWRGCRWRFIPDPPADPRRGLLHAAASDLQRRLLHQAVPGTFGHAEGISGRRAAATRAAGGLRRQDEQRQPGFETKTRGRHHLPRLHTRTQGQRWLVRQGGHTHRPQRGKLLPRSLPHPKHAPLWAPRAQSQQRFPLSSRGLLRQRYRQRLRVPHGWIRDLAQGVVCLKKGAKREKTDTWLAANNLISDRWIVKGHGTLSLSNISALPWLQPLNLEDMKLIIQCFEELERLSATICVGRQWSFSRCEFNRCDFLLVKHRSGV